MVGMQAGKTGTLRGLAFATLLLAGGAPMAQQGATDIARLEKLKSSVVEGVESRRKLSQVMNDTVFSFGELAYQELETSNYLTDVLEKNGFTIERGIAGMPTAWVARWGSGLPSSRSAATSTASRRQTRSPALPTARSWSRARPAMARATTPARPSASSPRSRSRT